MIFEDSREAQPMFQKVKMRLQHGRNPNFRSGGWQRTDLNGIRKDQDSKGMEDTDKSQRCGKLPGIRQFLSTLYTKLQPYCQTTKQAKRQERVEMGRKTSKRRSQVNQYWHY